MARPDKQTAVAELTDEFRSSQGAVLTEYRGLTVKQLQDLRRALGDNATLRRREEHADEDRGQGGGRRRFDALLNGPSAIAFIKGDAVEAAKSLRDFARTNPPLVIKGGVLDGKPLDDRRDRQDRRPRVARGSAGKARGRTAGVPAERRLPLQRAAGADRPPRRRAAEKAEQEGEPPAACRRCAGRATRRPTTSCGHTSRRDGGCGGGTDTTEG